MTPPAVQADEPLPPEPDGLPLPEPDEPLPPEPEATPAAFPVPERESPAAVPEGDTPLPDAPRGEPTPAHRSQAAPAPLPPALCDDRRWRAFVEGAAALSPHLGAKLRLAEVGALEEDALEAIPADRANGLSPGELERLAPALRESFGPAFHIRLNDDKKRKARDAHTIAGRNRLEAEARLAARRAAAERDESVQRLLRFFPKARVVDVALSEPAHPNRSDDV
jgi:hypothetical protein